MQYRNRTPDDTPGDFEEEKLEIIVCSNCNRPQKQEDDFAFCEYCHEPLVNDEESLSNVKLSNVKPLTQKIAHQNNFNLGLDQDIQELNDQISADLNQ